MALTAFVIICVLAFLLWATGVEKRAAELRLKEANTYIDHLHVTRPKPELPPEEHIYDWDPSEEDEGDKSHAR